jgi:hypothetical protein
MANNKFLFAISIAAVIVISAAVIPTTLAGRTGEQGNMTYIPKRVLTLQTQETLPTAEAASTCDNTLETARSQVPFPVKTPSVLPEGYRLQSVTVTPGVYVLMKYYDGAVCGPDGKSLRDGVLEIAADSFSQYTANENAEEYINRIANGYRDHGINATTYQFSPTIHAVAYPAGIGTSNAYDVDQNNKLVHSYQYDYPASIRLVDDSNGTVHNLTAFLPVEDLVKIAESLK